MNYQIKKQFLSKNQIILPLVKYFIQNNLKLKNCMIENICWIVHRQHEFLPYLEKFEQDSDYQLSQQDIVTLGNLVFSCKERWPLMIVLCITEQILNGGSFDRISVALDAFLKQLQVKELMHVWTIPSIINVNLIFLYECVGK